MPIAHRVAGSSEIAIEDTPQEPEPERTGLDGPGMRFCTCSCVGAFLLLLPAGPAAIAATAPALTQTARSWMAVRGRAHGRRHLIPVPLCSTSFPHSLREDSCSLRCIRSTPEDARAYRPLASKRGGPNVGVRVRCAASSGEASKKEPEQPPPSLHPPVSTPNWSALSSATRMGTLQHRSTSPQGCAWLHKGGASASFAVLRNFLRLPAMGCVVVPFRSFFQPAAA